MCNANNSVLLMVGLRLTAVAQGQGGNHHGCQGHSGITPQSAHGKHFE